MIRLFISYSRQTQAVVDELTLFLLGKGVDIWVDHAKLTPGTVNWQKAIDEGIRQATHVIYCASIPANESDYVNAEVQLAIHYRKPVIPYWVDGGPWVKCAPMEMSRAQYIDARGANRTEAKERLAQTLGLDHRPLEGPIITASPITPASQASAYRVDQALVPAQLQQLGFEGRTYDVVQVIIPPTVEIPAGPFLMGSDKRTEQIMNDQVPQHTVTLQAYRMARHPLTVAEYACFVRATHRREPASSRSDISFGYRYSVTWQHQLERLDDPVVCISWQDALAYTQWLAHITGDPWRLPTEAEWEKAARGTSGRLYPWGNVWNSANANTYEAGRGTTTPAGSYPAGTSPYGIFDMCGNVWEYTSTIFKAYPYDAADGREDILSTKPRVLRGGAFNTNDAGEVRAAFRLDDRGFMRFLAVHDANCSYYSHVRGARLVCDNR